MRQLTPEQRRKIANYMRNRRRQMRTPEARRYPKTASSTATYIEQYNKINSGSYRQGITLDY
jgi:transposase InsO family protein